MLFLNLVALVDNLTKAVRVDLYGVGTCAIGRSVGYIGYEVSLRSQGGLYIGQCLGVLHVCPAIKGSTVCV